MLIKPVHPRSYAVSSGKLSVKCLPIILVTLFLLLVDGTVVVNILRFWIPLPHVHSPTVRLFVVVVIAIAVRIGIVGKVDCNF